MQVARRIPPWLLLIAMGTAAAQSDKQKLWENAANYASDNQRCSSLQVYPSHESTCNSNQSVVRECADVGLAKCGRVFSQAQQSMGCIRKANADRKELVSRRSSLESRISSAPDSEKKKIEDEIKSIGNLLNELDQTTRECENKLEEDRRDMSVYFDLSKKCVAARESVLGAFSDAIDAAERESDTSISAPRDKLLSGWKPSLSGHKEAVTNWRTARDDCERHLDKAKVD